MIKVELKGHELTMSLAGTSDVIATELHAISERLNESYGDDHPEVVARFAVAFISGLSPKVMNKIIDAMEEVEAEAKRIHREAQA